MTLINFLTRVHFADNVLEEALHSEMEHHAKRRPFIIADETHLVGSIAERFFSSFPIRTRAEIYSTVSMRATEAAAREIAERYRRNQCDLLIAFGSNRAMDLAKVARIAIAYDEPIAALSREEGGAQRISAELPDLYSVPTVLGFASAITDYTRVRLDTGGQAMLSSPHLIPTVTVCDPSLTLGASNKDTAIAAAGVLARSIDGYLAPAYNPPADALALDSMARIMANVPRILTDDSLERRREMMAAGLNSSMALQKGLCAIHAISNAVAAVTPAAIDPSSLGGLLIPELAGSYGPVGDVRQVSLRRNLRITGDQSIDLRLRAFMDDLPMASSLSELGVALEDLPTAAALATRDQAIGHAPVSLSQKSILEILTAVHDRRHQAVAGMA